MSVRDNLQRKKLDLFWRFIHERQSVWHKRAVLDNTPPWTDDQILRNNRFTNIYRELDPGTQYAIQSILERNENKPDKIFNIMIYRLIGRSETHKHIGFQRLEEFDRAKLENALKERRDKENKPVFTGAYMVSGYNHMGSSDKIENVSKIFKNLKDRFSKVYDEITGAEKLKQAYEAIRRNPGYGNFLAYQVVVDLLYPLRALDGKSILPFSQNEWSSPGPGAQRGIEVLVNKPKKNADLEIMDWLRQNQKEEFKRLGLDFEYLRGESGQVIEISLANIQNCLCEFYKYHKIRNDDGRARRRFRISNARTGSSLQELYTEYPISLDRSHYE